MRSDNFIGILVLLIGILLISMQHRSTESRIEEYRVQMEKGIELSEACLEELTEAQRGYRL